MSGDEGCLNASFSRPLLAGPALPRHQPQFLPIRRKRGSSLCLIPALWCVLRESAVQGRTAEAGQVRRKRSPNREPAGVCRCRFVEIVDLEIIGGIAEAGEVLLHAGSRGSDRTGDRRRCSGYGSSRNGSRDCGRVVIGIGAVDGKAGPAARLQRPLSRPARSRHAWRGGHADRMRAHQRPSGPSRRFRQACEWRR